MKTRRLKKWVVITLIILLYSLATLFGVMIVLGSKGLVYPIIMAGVCTLMGVIIKILLTKGGVL